MCVGCVPSAAVCDILYLKISVWALCERQLLFFLNVFSCMRQLHSEGEHVWFNIVWLWLYWMMQCMSSVHAGLSSPFNLVCGHFQTHEDKLKIFPALSFFLSIEHFVIVLWKFSAYTEMPQKQDETQNSSSGYLKPVAMHHFLQSFFFLKCSLLFTESAQGTQQVKLAVFSQSTLQHKKLYISDLLKVYYVLHGLKLWISAK